MRIIIIYDHLLYECTHIIYVSFGFRCRAGYYGDPRPGSVIGCRPCMCPGGEGSDYQHGDTCQLDTRVNAVVCDCRPGYTGEYAGMGDISTRTRFQMTLSQYNMTKHKHFYCASLVYFSYNVYFV